MVSPTDTRTQLVLSEDPGGYGRAANWIGRMMVLGTRAARYHRRGSDRQLIIALSVPKRDFAAALVGCGWVLASEPPNLADPLETLRKMQPGQPLRAVNSKEVISGTFSFLNESSNPPRAQFAGVQWSVDKIRALAPLATSEEQGAEVREPRPEPGSLEHIADLHLTWDARLALPAADLAIVGTLTWLEQDLDGYLVKEGDTFQPTSIRALLSPKVPRSATWFTRLLSSAHHADHLPLAADLNAVILDGNGAVKYLEDIETPVVICILDRSVADETAAELVVQLRNTRGEPMSLSHDLGWTPPAGVEALAFSVAL